MMCYYLNVYFRGQRVKAADLNLRNSLIRLGKKSRTATATFVTLWDNTRTHDFQSDKVGTLRHYISTFRAVVR